MKREECFQGLCFSGEVEKRRDGIYLEGKLKGKVEVECIRCLSPFLQPVEEEVKFKVVKTPYSGTDGEFDIFEMEKFDLKEILRSEVESIRNDYNICPNCQGREIDLEF
ncbi:MAG: hypothetical protein C6I01_00550 [Epsilonproteobacteria bacterium]|nr:hypothetical protein [Campylobacterota bacterium]NPA88937.1 hypothetical protein [Campylobacterota bacterium]